MNSFLNALISLLAQIGLYVCALIAITMVNTKLGIVTFGLYAVKQIAEYLIAKEYREKMKNLFKQAEKLE